MRYTADAVQQALGFLNSQLSYIEQQVNETVYPEIQYSSLIPVDTSANEWAKSITYYSQNKTGAAGWFHGYAKDGHVADVERSSNEVGVYMADIGYRWTVEELGTAALIPGMNLSTDRANAARRAYEEFMDALALRGNAEKNLKGLMNYPGITVVDAAAVGTPGDQHSIWANKDADQIMADVNALLTGQYVDTLQVELADTLLMPIEATTLLASKRIPDTDSTIWDFLMTKNVYTAQTGRPLTMRGVRGLESAGTGGSGRLVAYRRDPAVLKLHVPMTHRFLPVWQTGPLVFDVPGIFRTAGLEIRRPGAVRYLDGITGTDVT